MVPFRYSVRALILVLTLVAVYFPLARLYDSWFASTYGEYYTANVLGFRIHNGDSFRRVASYFGSHRPVGRDHQLGLISIEELCASNNLPIEEGDQFYRFSTPGSDSGVYLQFRDDKLINLTNTTYSNANSLARMNGNALPHPALTHGFLPLYLITVLVVTLLYSFRMSLRRRWSALFVTVQSQLTQGR